MTKNMGNTDRIIRLVLAAIFGMLYFTKTVTGTPGIVLLILGAVLLVVSMVGVCPLYSIFGIKTCKAK